MEKRLAIGDVSRSDVDAGRADLASARLAARSAEARVAGSLAALAGSLGVTVPAIDGVPLVWLELGRLPGRRRAARRVVPPEGPKTCTP